jgi:two-component system NtrC family sensor kinase
VAHEVKNPLAVLQMGLGYLAKQSKPESEPVATVVKEMGDAINRANAVVADLLDFAAPKQLDLRDREIEPLIRRSVTLVRHELNAAKVKVTTNFAGQLPPCAVDRDKIKQVFVNLFTNACHAMPEGGVLTVTTLYRRATEEEASGGGGDRSGTRLRGGDGVVVVEIADTGSGIPAEQLPKIFDPYFTTKPTGKGTGLGLTVTKAIIDMHGGRINISNASGGGVIVRIMLKTRGEDEKS